MKLNLPDFATFVSVAKHQSFRAAGVELGVSPSAVSHSISQLEQRLKLRLLNRTTRSVSLTEAGQRFYERIAPAFEDLYLSVDELNHFRDSPVGTLRINAARQAARLFLAPVITEFVRDYPGIRVEVTADDRLADVVSGGFDAGVRLGARVEKDMIALPVGPPVRFRVVATPDYFARCPAPLTPEALTEHRCVVFRFPSGRPYHWEFEHGGVKTQVAVAGDITTDDMDFELDAVLRGAGVGYLFDQQVSPHIASGRLTPVLDDYLPARLGFHLYYPNRSYMSYGLRAFLEYIKCANLCGETFFTLPPAPA